MDNGRKKLLSEPQSAIQDCETWQREYLISQWGEECLWKEKYVTVKLIKDFNISFG